MGITSWLRKIPGQKTQRRDGKNKPGNIASNGIQGELGKNVPQFSTDGVHSDCSLALRESATQRKSVHAPIGADRLPVRTRDLFFERPATGSLAPVQENR